MTVNAREVTCLSMSLIGQLRGLTPMLTITFVWRTRVPATHGTLRAVCPACQQVNVLPIEVDA